MGDVLGEMRNELVLGFLALSLGDPGRACEHLRPLVERLRASGIVEPGIVPALPLAAEAMVGVGDLEGATALADELEELGGRLDRPWARVTAARCHALAAAATGDLAGALDRIARADPDDRRLGDPFERARTRLVQGTLLRRAKKRGAARTAIEEAIAGFTAIGTPLWAERARAELERLGPPPARRRADRGRGEDRRARRLRSEQPGDREPALHLGQDRGGEPLAVLPQARRPLPRPTGSSPRA